MARIKRYEQQIKRYEQQTTLPEGSKRPYQPFAFDDVAQAQQQAAQAFTKLGEQFFQRAAVLRDKRAAAEIVKARAEANKMVNDFMLSLNEMPNDFDKFGEMWSERQGEISDALQDTFTSDEARSKFMDEYFPLFSENVRFEVAKLAQDKEQEYTLARGMSAIQDAINAEDIDGINMGLESIRGLIPEPQWEKVKEDSITQAVVNIEYNRMDDMLAQGEEWEVSEESAEVLGEKDIHTLRSHWQGMKSQQRMQENLERQERHEATNNWITQQYLTPGGFVDTKTLQSFLTNDQLDANSVRIWDTIFKKKAEEFAAGVTTYDKELSEVVGGVEGNKETVTYYNKRLEDPNVNLNELHLELISDYAKDKLTTTDFRIIQEKMSNLEKGIGAVFNRQRNIIGDALEESLRYFVDEGIIEAQVAAKARLDFESLVYYGQEPADLANVAMSIMQGLDQEYGLSSSWFPIKTEKEKQYEATVELLKAIQAGSELSNATGIESINVTQKDLEAFEGMGGNE